MTAGDDSSTRPPAGARDLSAELLAVIEAFARESGLRPSSAEPGGAIGLDTRLESDLGLDSLGRAELIARIERELGVGLPEDALLAATPRDLLHLIALSRIAGAGSPAAKAPETASLPAIGSRIGPGIGTAAGSATGPAIGPAQPPTRHLADAATLLDALDWHLTRHPERVHIFYQISDSEAEPISYAALRDGAARVAGRLIRKGLRPGDRVALMLPTGPEYFFAFFGILVAGGIPVPIYPPARPRQIEDHLRRHARILANAGTSYLITVREARALGRLLGALVPGLRGVFTLEGLDAEAAADAGPRADPEAIALLQYTSGSTGDPKGVILSHADVLANIRAMGRAVEATADDVFVSWLPLYHDMGLIGAWLGSLYFGVPLVALSPLAFLARPLRWLTAIDRYRGTLSAAPNFAYELCLARIDDAERDRLDLRSWRWALNGAEPVSAQTLRRFAKRFAPCGLRAEAIAPVYGLAEAAVGLAFPPAGRGPRIDCIDGQRLARHGHALRIAPDDPTAREIVACGQPLPGYRLRVVGSDGRPLPERHEGVLQFQGPSATRGYYDNPEATARLIRRDPIHGVWHDTGDRAYLAGGDVHITGRVKDLIIRGGRNIYPYELEQAVGEIPGIRQGCVAAFAAPSPKDGTERLVVVAETREQDRQRRLALVQAVRERADDILGLPPDEVVLAPPRTVPKTSSGKLRRGAARDLYLADRLRTGPAHPLWQLLRVGAVGAKTRLAGLARQSPRYLYAAYVWALIGLCAPLVALGIFVLPRPPWRQALARGAAGLLRRLAFVRLRIEGLEHLPPDDRPFVLVANHQSYIDAFVLIESIPRPLTFVAKRELAPIPVVGRALARQGTLFVERFDLKRSADESRHFAAALQRRENLAFFPEGTFREDAGLLPFRMGAFAAAAQAGVPVVPVALVGTRRILRGETWLPAPGRVEVIIGCPLSPGLTPGLSPGLAPALAPDLAPGLAPEPNDWPAAVRLRDRARDFVLRHCGERDSEAVYSNPDGGQRDGGRQDGDREPGP